MSIYGDFLSNFSSENKRWKADLKNKTLICEDKKYLKPYLYASYKYMSMEEYHILLTKHADYVEVNAQMRQEVEDVKAKSLSENNEIQIDEWKRKYRRSNM